MAAERMNEASAFHRPAGPVRLRTLVFIRWIAIAGQLVTLLTVNFTLGFDLPLLPTLGAIALSALINVLSTALWPAQTRLSDTDAALYLAYDVIQLSVLLALTGGLQNPFALLFVVPVTVAATILSLRSTVALGALALVCISLVAVFHWPLPWGDVPLLLPPLYLTGLWAALVLGTIFIAAYTFRVAAEARRMTAAYNALQAALAREQRLSELGALAAAAAHELGTPLSTIAVVTKEIARDLPADSPYREDVALLTQQIGRCREILGRIAGLGQGALDSPYGRLPVSGLAEAAAAPHRPRDRAVTVVPQPLDGAAAAEPEVARRAEIMHGLGNLVENAVEFCRDEVEVRVGWDDQRVVIEVLDDGPGFPPGLLAELGEPYVSTRRGAGRLGLGLFIAKTLLERTGGAVVFRNQAGGGARVTVEWPRAVLEAIPAEGSLPATPA
ncbi:MAG: ActS/PrrB/RegB family redox-sensitive histidine kinase [Alphaproteobacteria bacterium]